MAKIKNAQAFTSPLSMSANAITNVEDPTNAQDAATKAYVDANSGSPSTWSTFPATQDVDMDTFQITDLGDPTLAQDAVTKNYADTTFVALTGDQTVAGKKTFSTVPASSQDPSAGDDLVRKSYADSTYAELTQATVQTTDATPTALATIAIATNSAVTVYANISAAKADYTDAVGGFVSAVVLRAGASPALVDTTFPVTMPSTTATFDAVVSGNNLLIQVTGIAATTYNWKVRYFTVVQNA